MKRLICWLLTVWDTLHHWASGGQYVMSGHDYEEVETCDAVASVQVLKCRWCKDVSIAWQRKPPAHSKGS